MGNSTFTGEYFFSFFPFKKCSKDKRNSSVVFFFFLKLVWRTRLKLLYLKWLWVCAEAWGARAGPAGTGEGSEQSHWSLCMAGDGATTAPQQVRAATRRGQGSAPGRSLSWRGRKLTHFPEGSVEAPGSGIRLGSSPESGTLPAAPQQPPLSTLNLCPKSLLGLKVTLQLSICTDALKEKRGSASQSIFQIGDKNWLVMAENSTKDYYCW